jgi:hypothetical protein
MSPVVAGSALLVANDDPPLLLSHSFIMNNHPLLALPATTKSNRQHNKKTGASSSKNALLFYQNFPHYVAAFLDIIEFCKQNCVYPHEKVFHHYVVTKRNLDFKIFVDVIKNYPWAAIVGTARFSRVFWKRTLPYGSIDYFYFVDRTQPVQRLSDEQMYCLYRALWSRRGKVIHHGKEGFVTFLLQIGTCSNFLQNLKRGFLLELVELLVNQKVIESVNVNNQANPNNMGNALVEEQEQKRLSQLSKAPVSNGTNTSAINNNNTGSNNTTTKTIDNNTRSNIKTISADFYSNSKQQHQIVFNSAILQRYLQQFAQKRTRCKQQQKPLLDLPIMLPPPLLTDRHYLNAATLFSVPGYYLADAKEKEEREQVLSLPSPINYNSPANSSNSSSDNSSSDSVSSDSVFSDSNSISSNRSASSNSSTSNHNMGSGSGKFANNYRPDTVLSFLSTSNSSESSSRSSSPNSRSSTRNSRISTRNTSTDSVSENSISNSTFETNASNNNNNNNFSPFDIYGTLPDPASYFSNSLMAPIKHPVSQIARQNSTPSLAVPVPMIVTLLSSSFPAFAKSPTQVSADSVVFAKSSSSFNAPGTTTVKPNNIGEFCDIWVVALLEHLGLTHHIAAFQNEHVDFETLQYICAQRMLPEAIELGLNVAEACFLFDSVSKNN